MGAALPVQVASGSDRAEQVRRSVASSIGEFKALRRDLHQHPELSFQEFRTAAIVAERLAQWGYEVTTGIAGTGVVGTLRVGSGGTKGSIKGNVSNKGTLVFDRSNGQAFAGVRHVAAGHSFGGVLTALIAGEHRGLFERVVLLDPVLFSPTMLMGMSLGELTGVIRHTPLARQARGRRDHWASRDEARANLTGRGTYKGWADEAMDAFLTHALADADDGVRLKCQPSREAEIFSSGPDRLWSVLGRVRTPVLMLHAQHTFPFVGEAAQRWRNINDAVETREVPGGHCFMQEDPAHAAEQVRGFLSEP